MSIQSEINRISSEVTTQTDLLGQIAAELAGKAAGGDIEIQTDKEAVTPSNVAQTVWPDSGYDALAKVTVKAIPSEYIVPSGTVSITQNGVHNVREAESVNVNVASTGVDTSDATATAADILSGKTAYAKGEMVTGTIATKTSSNLTASGATVTVPAGYYATQATKSVATATQATPTINVDANGKITSSATQTAGYVSAGTKSADPVRLTTQAAKTITPTENSQTAVAKNVYTTGVVTVGAISNTYVGSRVSRKSAQTYTPGTSNQTIASGQYLTGMQTIKGDANLLAANIKSGVSIFDVLGTFEGEGGGSSSGPYSAAEIITWTPAADTDSIEVAHSLGVVPDGFYVLIRTDLVNIEDYVITLNMDVNLLYADLYYFVTGVGYKEGTLTTVLYIVTDFVNDITAQNIKLGPLWSKFMGGATYEILVYKR